MCEIDGVLAPDGALRVTSERLRAMGVVVGHRDAAGYGKDRVNIAMGFPYTVADAR